MLVFIHISTLGMCVSHISQSRMHTVYVLICFYACYFVRYELH